MVVVAISLVSGCTRGDARESDGVACPRTLAAALLLPEPLLRVGQHGEVSLQRGFELRTQPAGLIRAGTRGEQGHLAGGRSIYLQSMFARPPPSAQGHA